MAQQVTGLRAVELWACRRGRWEVLAPCLKQSLGRYRRKAFVHVACAKRVVYRGKGATTRVSRQVRLLRNSAVGTHPMGKPTVCRDGRPGCSTPTSGNVQFPLQLNVCLGRATVLKLPALQRKTSQSAEYVLQLVGLKCMEDFRHMRLRISSE